MARMLIISTQGSEDPTHAGVAFTMAKGAVKQDTAGDFAHSNVF